jgi:CarD family transcriptional regulator
MFKVGDKIFYPMHGGGIISTIEDKEIFGEVQAYYVVSILHRNMQVMIPVNKTDNLKLRHIVDPAKLDNMLTMLPTGETDTTISDNQRHKINLNKIKSGDIYETAEVIRDLVRSNNKKKLSLVDSNMLDNARQILISEVVLVKGIEHDQATSLVNEIIDII